MTICPSIQPASEGRGRKNPLMNLASVTRIYWHAFKLYAIKKVPYIHYDEKLADSQQNKAPTPKDIL